MNAQTSSRVGGTCSILVGISYIAVGLTYLLLSSDQQSSNATRFFPAYANNPVPLRILWWAFVLGATFALGAVPAISDRVRAANEGLVRWTVTLASVGFAVTALDNLRLLALQPGRAAAYMVGDDLTRAVIARTNPLLGLDPDGWLTFGAVGLWLLTVNLLARRAASFPRPLVYVGVAGGVLYWFVVAGSALANSTLITVAAALGGVVVAPIWYIGVGLALRRLGGRQADTAPAISRPGVRSR